MHCLPSLNLLKHVIRMFTCGVALLMLSACDSGNLKPVGADETVLAFGDSLTEGKGVAPNQSYPVVLEQLIGRRVVNAGVSGEISADGLTRLPGLLDSVRPALLVLLHGGNDILRNMNLTNTRRNLARMIDLARERNIQVMLVGVPQKSLFSDSAAIYTELAEQYDLVFDDDIVADLIRSPSMKSDSVHFNADGYRALAVAISDKLQSAGAI